MTREELVNNIKLIWMKENPAINVSKADIEFGLEFAKLGIRYGFEKARELDASPSLHENARMIRPLYKSADEVLAELDKGQDDKNNG